MEEDETCPQGYLSRQEFVRHDSGTEKLWDPLLWSV